MKGRSQRYSTQGFEQDSCIFIFLSKKYFFDISIFGGRIGERKVSAVPTRYPEQDARIFVFQSKIFFQYFDFWRSHR